MRRDILSAWEQDKRKNYVLERFVTRQIDDLMRQRLRCGPRDECLGMIGALTHFAERYYESGRQRGYHWRPLEHLHDPSFTSLIGSGDKALRRAVDKLHIQADEQLRLGPLDDFIPVVTGNAHPLVLFELAKTYHNDIQSALDGLRDDQEIALPGVEPMPCTVPFLQRMNLRMNNAFEVVALVEEPHLEYLIRLIGRTLDALVDRQRFRRQKSGLRKSDYDVLFQAAETMLPEADRLKTWRLKISEVHG